MSNTLKIVIGACVASFFWIFIAFHYVNASEHTVYGQLMYDSTKNTYAGINSLGFAFTASTTYLSQLDFYSFSECGGTQQLEIYLCKGDPGNSSANLASYDGCGAYSQIASVILPNYSSASTTESDLQSWDFTEWKLLNYGDLYFFKFDWPEALETTCKFHLDFYTVDINPDTWIIASGDPRFSIFGDWNSNINEVSIIEEDIALLEYQDAVLSTDPTTHCYLNEDCTISFRYSKKAIGYDVISTPNNESYRIPEFAYSSTTLDYTFNLTEEMDMPDSGSSGILEYCLILYATTTKQYCGLNIIYSELPSIGFCSDNPCVQATTTWDSLFYAVECGIKKSGQWLFCPNDDTYKQFADTRQVLEGQFPFSLYHDMYNQWLTLNDTTYSTGTLPLPEINGQSAGNIIAPGDWTSTSAFQLYYQWMTRFLWIGVFLYIIWLSTRFTR